MTYYNALGVALAETGKSSTGILGSATSGNTLTGGDGNDGLRGLSYVTTYAGGKGDDSYYVSNKYDTVIENPSEGIDTVYAEQSFKLGANVENLTLVSPAAVYGEGNSMDNILTAKLGGQTLNGGGGNDVLVGLGNSETFIVAKGNGSDAIYGFNSTDKIRLDNYGITSFASLKSLGTQVGADTLLKFANGEQLVLRDTALSSLTADNFLLSHDTSKLVSTFDDEFNSLSLANKGGTWRTEYGWGGAGTLGSRSLNGEAEIYMDADYAGTGTKALGINPFSIDKGILTITAAPTPTEDKAALGNAAYTSGLLTTKFSFAQEYGYFEISAKMPTGQGIWPAFWLLPTDNSWPPELDVFEALGRDPSTVYMTSHGVDSTGKQTQTQSAVNIDYTQWHTYGADWGPNTITYYIDGQAVATQATPDSMKGKSMYMLIDLAVGSGGWAGSYDSTTGTQQMQVDYVHAYATANTVSTTVNGVTTAYAAPVATAPVVTVPVVSAPVVTVPIETTPVIAPPVATVPVVTTPVVTAPVVTAPIVTTPVVTAPATTAPATTTSDATKQLLGTAGADKLVAVGDGTDMYGYAGDDTLRAGTFSATMHGGLGNDTYYVSAANQLVVENPGEGADVVHATISYTLTANVETLLLDGSANINGTGNDTGVRITGNTGNNVITGGAGNDMLDGGTAGIDTLIGGKGDDTYYVNHIGTTLIEKPGEGNDTVHATISWTLGDNFETLVLEGSANINATGNNGGARLIGNTGNNVITGGAGNDILDGGTAGLDTLIGGKGNDTYYVNHAGTTLVENLNEGIDSVHSTISWTLGANFEVLALDGTANINGTGNALDNRIQGNSGNNILDGGAGNDTLTGNGGKDTFVFDQGFGKDIVTDFSGKDDYLQFHGYSKALMHIVQQGANTVIDFGGADFVTLLNIQANDPTLLAHLLF